MKESVLVRNSGDNFISVTTDEDSVIKRITKSGITPYKKQDLYNKSVDTKKAKQRINQ